MTAIEEFNAEIEAIFAKLSADLDKDYNDMMERLKCA